MSNNLYVKFVPCNGNFLKALIRKQMRFSTVFDFNDFNEFTCLSPSSSDIEGKTEEKLREILKTMSEKDNNCLFEKMVNWGYPYNDFMRKIECFLKNTDFSEEIPERYRMTLYEYACFANVGILCLSDKKVFDDDSGQLMFAHYANSLGGLALIYECSKEPISVYYSDITNTKPGLNVDPEYLANWVQGKFNKEEIGGFIKKSKKWEYEAEKRIFRKPGTYLFTDTDVDVILKAILYTSKLSENKINIIETINTRFYEGDLQVKLIIPSQENFMFILPDSKQKVSTWIDKEL